MFSGSTVIFTVFLASGVSSSFGAALRGASIATVSEPSDFDPASTEARVFAEEVFDPTGAEVQLFDEDSQVFANEVFDPMADHQVFDEDVIEAHREGEHFVFGQEVVVLQCANEAGVNPCGPGRACHDVEDGITCEDIPSLQGCPVGCAPNSSCIRQEDAFRCVCDEGFFRPHAYLSCIAMPESEIQL